jgi:AcrR family transcriptional regulator
LGTIRYYFGGRERLLVHVARDEHLAQLDRARRTLRSVTSTEELATTLLGMADDLDHFQVTFGLLTEARQMPELQAAHAQLWEDWLAKLTEMVAELQARGVVRPERDPYALALLWSSVTAGLAAHRLASPEIELRPALALAQLYAASLL